MYNCTAGNFWYNPKIKTWNLKLHVTVKFCVWSSTQVRWLFLRQHNSDNEAFGAWVSRAPYCGRRSITDRTDRQLQWDANENARWSSSLWFNCAGRAMRLTVYRSVRQLARPPCPSLSHSVSDHVRLIVRAHLVIREICRWRSPPQQQQQQQHRGSGDGGGGGGRRCLKPTHIHLSFAASRRWLACSQVFHYPRRLFITRTTSAMSLYNRTSRRLCDSVGTGTVTLCWQYVCM